MKSAADKIDESFTIPENVFLVCFNCYNMLWILQYAYFISACWPLGSTSCNN